MSMYDKNNKCPGCNEGVQKYKEYLPGLTIIYFSCGHKNKLTEIIEPTIAITDSISTKLNQDISKDYEELASFHMTMSPIKTAKLSDDEEGKMIFEGIKEKLFDIICVKANACEKIKTLDNSDLLSLVQWISDIIASISFGFPLPTAIIARIVVKRGICNFCNCA